MNKVLSAIAVSISLIIIFYLAFDAVFNSMLSSEHKTLEVTNTAIQFILLITGVITIIFLYINYHQQKKQIEDNNKDIEFNRLVNIIYKQEVNTTKLFKEKGQKIQNFNKLIKTRLVYHLYSDLDSHYLTIKELSEEMNFYYEFFQKSALNSDDLHVLNRIIKQNILKEFREILESYNLLFELTGSENADVIFKSSFINYLKSQVISQPDLVRVNSGLLTDEKIFESYKNTYDEKHKKFIDILNYLELIYFNNGFYTKKEIELEPIN